MGGWGTFLGVPTGAVVVFGDLEWGPPILGNYHMVSLRKSDTPKHKAAALPTARQKSAHL